MVTIGLSRTVSEINGGFRRKSPIFFHPVYFAPPLKRLALELGIVAGVRKKLESWGYRAEIKFDGIFSRLDTIHQRDGQTDGQTDRYRSTAKTARLRVASRGKNW